MRNSRPADQAGTAAARAAAGEARHVEDVGVLGMEHEEREAGGRGSQAGLLLPMCVSTTQVDVMEAKEIAEKDKKILVKEKQLLALQQELRVLKDSI